MEQTEVNMYDYHTHSNFSADSETPMSEMASAAVSLGLSEMAITDHYDPDYPLPDWFSDTDFVDYMHKIEETMSMFRGKILIKKGIEIGIQHGATLEKCSKTARENDFDFIIGSFHCAEGLELSCGDFFAGRAPDEAIKAFYRYNIECLSSFNDFDVLGHINVVDRYAPSLPDPEENLDLLSDVLTLLLEKGKGIEINTSSFRYKMGDHTTPTEQILKLYKKLGGEIITVGSDAHRPNSVGLKFDWAYEKLRELGFRYVTTFDQRKPIFNKL